MNMFARFDENPAMTLQDIKETKRYGRTLAQTHTRMHAQTDGQRENSIPTTKFAGGIIKYYWKKTIFYEIQCKKKGIPQSIYA